MLLLAGSAEGWGGDWGRGHSGVLLWLLIKMRGDEGGSSSSSWPGGGVAGRRFCVFARAVGVFAGDLVGVLGWRRAVDRDGGAAFGVGFFCLASVAGGFFTRGVLVGVRLGVCCGCLRELVAFAGACLLDGVAGVRLRARVERDLVFVPFGLALPCAFRELAPTGVDSPVAGVPSSLSASLSPSGPTKSPSTYS